VLRLKRRWRSTVVALLPPTALPAQRVLEFQLHRGTFVNGRVHDTTSVSHPRPKQFELPCRSELQSVPSAVDRITRSAFSSHGSRRRDAADVQRLL
jgi:hypothetical protein